MPTVAHSEFKTPDFQQQQRIIARAHRLRAQAMAHAFGWAFRALAGALGAAVAALRPGRRVA